MISILVSSLVQDLFMDLYPQLRDTGVPGEPIETVLVSPHPSPRAAVTWVKDDPAIGSSPAWRKALWASRGDICVCLNDDLRLDPGWLAPSLAMLTKPNQIIAISFGPRMTAFGLPYANIPLFRRQTALDNYTYFYPYCTQYGDVSFSMGVWKSGGEVVQGPGQPVHFLAPHERKGNPESPRKDNKTIYREDTRRFLRDHRDVAEDWMIKHMSLWNWDQSQGQWPSPEKMIYYT